MSKAILLSIQPKWVEKILNGEKTIEIRKTMPKCELPIDVFIYCTKSKKDFVFQHIPTDNEIIHSRCINGNVVAKFTLNKVDRYDYGNMDYPTPAYEGDPTCAKIGDGYWIRCFELDKTCLTYDELVEYGKGKTLYGWNIDNLKKFNYALPIREAPQRWMYVNDLTKESVKNNDNSEM